VKKLSSDIIWLHPSSRERGIPAVMGTMVALWKTTGEKKGSFRNENKKINCVWTQHA